MTAFSVSMSISETGRRRRISSRNSDSGLCCHSVRQGTIGRYDRKAESRWVGMRGTVGRRGRQHRNGMKDHATLTFSSQDATGGMQMGLTAEQKQQLITKAMKDEAFRAALQRDARATIAQELQVPLPPEVTLHVLAPEAHEV